MTASGAASVLYRSDQVFTIAANQGYVISNVLVDGVSIPETIIVKMAVVTGTRRSDKSIETDCLTFLP